MRRNWSKDEKSDCGFIAIARSYYGTFWMFKYPTKPVCLLAQSGGESGILAEAFN